MDWVRGHARDEMIGPGFSCVMCSVPAVGSRHWEGPSEDVLCQFDVFNVEVVSGPASAYWVVGF